jgi:CBS domain-containing protein
MTAEPQCCQPEDTATRAAEIMRQEDVGPVPVVRGMDGRQLIGLVTDRDIALKVVAAGRNPQTTRVEEVMTRDLVTCGPNEDYGKALARMAKHQVRRIPVVDENRSLLGIISQADVAQASSEREVGQVVEDISEPAGIGRKFKRSHFSESREHEFGAGSATAGSALVGTACFAIGAGIMYLLDPDRGRSRRSNIRNRATGLYNDSAGFAGKVGRDFRNRATGVLAESKSMLSRHPETPDAKLVARVRTRLGRVSSHTRAIEVTAENGRVTLTGPVLAAEVNDVLSGVQGVPGVAEIDNRLEIHEQPDNIPSLQGESRPSGERWEFMQTNWTPAARVVAGALGGGLAFYGMRAQGPVAKAVAASGLVLLARSVANRDVSSMADLHELIPR